MKFINAALKISTLFLWVVCQSAFSQPTYPSRPITIVVPWPAGGAADFIARVISPSLSQRLGQPVIVENKPGAATNLGTQFVSSSTPDGYTILMASSNNCVNATLTPNSKIDFVKDFRPITNVGLAPNILVVNPEVPAKTVSELIALAKAKPGVLNYGSSGNGSAAQLGAEKFKSATGINIVGIQYKGAAPAVVDLVSGQISMMFTVIPATKSFVDSGRLRLLGVASLERLPIFPDAPTISESGIKGFESGIWYGLVAPVKTPGGIVDKLNKEVVEILKDPTIIKKFQDFGVFPIGDTQTAFAQTISSDIKKYADLIKKNNIQAE